MIRLKSFILLTFLSVFILCQTSQATELKVLSFNAWFLRIAGLVELSKDNALRLSKMPDALVETGADIIALQEVWTSYEREALKKAMQERGFVYVAERNDLSCLWFNNGLMIFSRFEMNPTINYNVFSSYTRADEFFTMKGAIHAQINVPDVGWIDFYTTHLGALSFDDTTSSYYESQIKVMETQANEFIDFVKATRMHSTQIIAGDLNQHPFKWDSASKAHSTDKDIVYHIVTEHGLFVDTVDQHKDLKHTYHSGNTYVSDGHFSGSPDVCIDYVFINDGERSLHPIASALVFDSPTIEAADGRKVFLSDHSGLLATFATSAE